MPEITKQDALRWLDMQRDAVNTEIVYAPQSEKKQYHQHLEIINALVDRVKEMSAVEYLAVCSEICEGREFCEGCKLCDCCPFCMAQDNPRRAVEIVKRWREEQDGH